MGDALLDLQRVLISKKEKLTPEEYNVLSRCRSIGIRSLALSSSIIGGIVWAATRRLPKILQANLTGGAALYAGVVGANRFLESCLDRILAMDGTVLQRELANIIIKNYQNDQWRMRLISKHFYTEEVFDDSTLDKPNLRWRQRRFFVDGITASQNTHENDSHQDADSNQTDFNSLQSNKSSSKSKQIHMETGAEVVTDPLDCVFGYSRIGEEIHHPNSSDTSARIHSRRHKRYHRRHRLHHQEEP
ncbi:hypothetical protein RJ641_004040 [Dillenia turbinata]|uniref:Uncharacterized protein n=1 Tax=Dillenia turbinata TaxID=194707 RepID=A0AAN8VHC5_9MAGN